MAADDYSIKVKFVVEDLEKKLFAAFKKVQPVVKEVFLGVLDIFAPELSVLIDGVKNEVVKIMQMIKGREREGATFLERMTERLTGEAAAVAPAVAEAAAPAVGAGGAAAGAGAGAAGAAGAAAAPALAVVAIQSLISIIKQVLDYLKRVSALLGALFKLIETSIMLLIKPIADFIGYMLKPIVMLILRFFVIPFYRTIVPIIKEIGDLWDKIFTQIMTPLMPILKEVAQILAQVLPYILPVLLPIIISLVSAILGPLILIGLAIKGLQIVVDWIWKGLQWIWKGLEGFAKWWATVVWSGIVRFFTTIWDALKNFVNWLRGAWNWVTNNIIKPIWDAIQGFIKWLQNGWDWVVNNIFKPIYNFLKGIADALGGVGKALDSRNWGKAIGDAFKPVGDFFKNLFGFQWGGVVQRTGFYRLHAGETVVPPGQIPQTVFVYPRIEIGTVNLGSEKDLSRLEERINKAIADALRRRRV